MVRLPGGGGFAVAFDGESLIKGYDLYGYRRGGTFDSPKVPKSDLGLRPKDPTHRNARPESQSDGFPERGLNGAYKVQRRIFIAAALERRTANHHPCPLLRGGELWGRKTNTF